MLAEECPVDLSDLQGTKPFLKGSSPEWNRFVLAEQVARHHAPVLQHAVPWMKTLV